MGKLSFELGFKTDELRNIQLPVEVRRLNLSLVSRNLASDTIDVAPGRYFVSARLPAGQELSAEVTIQGSDSQTARLAPEQADESPHESHETQRFLRGLAFSTLTMAPTLETLGPATKTMRTVVALHQTSDPRKPARVPGFQLESVESIPDGVQFYVQGRPAPHFLEFQLPNERVIYTALTVSPQHRCLVVCKRVNGSGCRVTTHLDNNVADLLARGLERGYLEEAAVATQSLSGQAEVLVQEKEGDPVAAAVGAYALLQFGELERLHHWTENLSDWFPWLADGVVIRAEHLARLGNHQEALTALLELKTRGMPLFSLGLTYALERLKLYTKLKQSTFSPQNVQAAALLLESLQGLSSDIDFSNAALTMFGSPSSGSADTTFDISAWM